MVRLLKADNSLALTWLQPFTSLVNLIYAGGKQCGMCIISDNRRYAECQRKMPIILHMLEYICEHYFKESGFVSNLDT